MLVLFEVSREAIERRNSTRSLAMIRASNRSADSQKNRGGKLRKINTALVFCDALDVVIPR